MHFYIMTQLRNVCVIICFGLALLMLICFSMQWAGPMQAPNVANKLGLVHNVGLGGAVVISILKRPDFWKEGGKDGRDRYVAFI
jgi:sterol carrier protein 2